MNKYSVKKDNNFCACLLSGFVPDAELDFHEYPSSLHEVDVERILNDFIDNNYFQGNKKLLVITGKGELIRPAANKTLSKNKHVDSFKSAGYFNGQSGAFEVILKN